MGAAQLTKDQVRTLRAVVKAHPNEPEVIWAALAGMDDDYAKAGF